MPHKKMGYNAGSGKRSRYSSGRNLGRAVSPVNSTADGYAKMMKECGHMEDSVGSGQSQYGRKK